MTAITGSECWVVLLSLPRGLLAVEWVRGAPEPKMADVVHSARRARQDMLETCPLEGYTLTVGHLGGRTRFAVMHSSVADANGLRLQ